MTSLYFWLSLFFCILIVPIGRTSAGIFSVHLEYHPHRAPSSLRETLGSTLGIAPGWDRRPDQDFIGHHVSSRRVSTYLQSEPSPLVRAIREAFSNALSPLGVRTVSISQWDGSAESLKQIEADSVILVEIKRFWTEGRPVALRTHVNTSIHLTLILGIKEESRIFTQRIYLERNRTLSRWTPEQMEQRINDILTDILDSFLANASRPSSKE